jgi:hypothetical protein
MDKLLSAGVSLLKVDVQRWLTVGDVPVCVFMGPISITKWAIL